MKSSVFRPVNNWPVQGLQRRALGRNCENCTEPERGSSGTLFPHQVTLIIWVSRHFSHNGIVPYNNMADRSVSPLGLERQSGTGQLRAYREGIQDGTEGNGQNPGNQGTRVLDDLVTLVYSVQGLQRRDSLRNNIIIQQGTAGTGPVNRPFGWNWTEQCCEGIPGGILYPQLPGSRAGILSGKVKEAAKLLYRCGGFKKLSRPPVSRVLDSPRSTGLTARLLATTLCTRNHPPIKRIQQPEAVPARKTGRPAL